MGTQHCTWIMNSGWIPVVYGAGLEVHSAICLERPFCFWKCVWKLLKVLLKTLQKNWHWHIFKAFMDRLETPSHHKVSWMVYIKRKASKERDQHHVLDRRPTTERGQGKGGQGSKQQSGQDKKKKSNIGCIVQNKQKIQGKCSVARKGDII